METYREPVHGTSEDLIMKSNSNNTSCIKTDQSPAITSSRYSNSNTACTRNLFTPSEDN